MPLKNAARGISMKKINNRFRLAGSLVLAFLIFTGAAFPAAAAETTAGTQDVSVARTTEQEEQDNAIGIDATSHYGEVAQIDLVRQAAAKAMADYREAERIQQGLQPQALTVRQDGTGMYTSLAEAVDAAHNGDILIVGPGVYEEHVNNRYKYLAIIGETGNPADVVIESGGKDYFNTPLDMCCGILRNLTVHAINAGEETVEGLYAYALHCDFEAEQNSTFLIENCVFSSDLNTAVGLGTKLNTTITFRNCTIENNSSGPALFLHDYECLQPHTFVGTQKVIFDGCHLISHEKAVPTIVLMSEELCEGAAEITFRNNTITGGEGSRAVETEYFDAFDPLRQLSRRNFAGSSDWVLTPDSAGNNVDILNYTADLISASGS